MGGVVLLEDTKYDGEACGSVLYTSIVHKLRHTPDWQLNETT